MMSSTTLILIRRTAAAAVVCLLAACQAYAPDGLKPGTTRAQVEAGMGAPTASYPLADGGQQVEYARGPFGKHTYMLAFDAAGRLTGSEQVLTEANFARIAQGQSRDDVLRAIGHPSEVRRLGYQKRMLWSYRYDALFCIWYQVSFDTAWQVVDTGYGPDPLCDHDERPW
jgi:outer membrane protein assembly factor BamE (lipoprotein component of BamABCDE complex)